jgi:hypothetical protein
MREPLVINCSLVFRQDFAMGWISKVRASGELMKVRYVIGVLLAMPVIAWLPARLWTTCGNPWCLKIYPDWLDKMIYSLAHQYLADDISMAAEQMDFLEVWIASVLILQIVSLSAMFWCKDKFRDDE